MYIQKTEKSTNTADAENEYIPLSISSNFNVLTSNNENTIINSDEPTFLLNNKILTKSNSEVESIVIDLSANTAYAHAMSMAEGSGTVMTILDQGASRHLKRDSNGLLNVGPVKSRLRLIIPDGSFLEATEEGQHPTIPGTFYIVCNLSLNLVSLGELEKHHCKYAYPATEEEDQNARFMIDSEGHPIIITSRNTENNLYYFDLENPTELHWPSVAAASELLTPLIAAAARKLWTSTARPPIRQLILLIHLGFGHLSKEAMINMVKHKLIDNFPAEITEKAIRQHYDDCTGCVRGQAERIRASHQPIAQQANAGEVVDLSADSDDDETEAEQLARLIPEDKRRTRTGKPLPSKPGDHVTCDISDWGASAEDKRYTAYFKDDVSNFIIAVHMNTITELAQAISKADLECKAEGRTLKCLKADVQYFNSEIVTQCKRNQTDMESSASYEHQQNGTAENTVKIMDRATRSILATTDKLFPAGRKRTEATDRAVMSWNATRSSRDDPSISAYSCFKKDGRRWDFDKYPMLPFGMRLEALEDAKTLNKIDSRTSVGYALNPVLTGYQTINIFNVETQSARQRRSYWTVGHPLTDFMVVGSEDITSTVEVAQEKDVANPQHAVDRMNRNMRNKVIRTENAIVRKFADLGQFKARLVELRAAKIADQAVVPAGPKVQLNQKRRPKEAAAPRQAQVLAPADLKLKGKVDMITVGVPPLAPVLASAPAPANDNIEPLPAPQSIKNFAYALIS